MLWGVFFKNRFIFSKNSVFPEFRLIQSVFRSIEITFKILCELLSVSINRNWFSINRKSWVRFLKKSYLTCSNHFSKLFQTPFSLSNSNKHNPQFFVVFDQIFCKVLLSQGRYVHYTLSFSFIFSFSCIFFMHWRVIFGLSNILEFLMIQTIFCEIDHWVFVLGCYKHDLCGLIWSILWFLRNWKF